MRPGWRLMRFCAAALGVVLGAPWCVAGGAGQVGLGMGGLPAHAAPMTGADAQALAGTITVTPSSGPIGTRVIVVGQGLSPGATISAPANSGLLRIGGISVLEPTQVITIDGGGGFSVEMVVGATSTQISEPGSKRVDATDSVGRTAAGVFVITARSLSLSPSGGGPGTRVMAAGEGFPPQATVTLRWNGAIWSTAIANGAGNFQVSATSVNSASVASGQAEVIATAPHPATLPAPLTLSATATFASAAAVIAPSVAEGAQGSSITVRGSGFQPQATVNAILIGALQAYPAGVAQADAAGSWSATILVPSLAPGVYLLTTTLNVPGGGIVFAWFRITERIPTAADLFATLGAYLVRVWGYNAATQRFELYDPQAAAASDLTTLVRGRGYWFNVRSEAMLFAGGNLYRLSPGWNLIGWLG